MSTQRKIARAKDQGQESPPPKKRSRPYSARPKRSVSERNGKLLTDEEVADILACTARQVRRLFYEGELPGVYVGGLFRVDKADVDAYIERRRVNRGPEKDA